MSSVVQGKREPFLGKTIFRWAATKKRGKRIGATETTEFAGPIWTRLAGPHLLVGWSCARRIQSGVFLRTKLPRTPQKSGIRASDLSIFLGFKEISPERKSFGSRVQGPGKPGIVGALSRIKRDSPERKPRKDTRKETAMLGCRRRNRYPFFLF